MDFATDIPTSSSSEQSSSPAEEDPCSDGITETTMTSVDIANRSRPCSRDPYRGQSHSPMRTQRSERLQQRLQASITGMRQLDELREKHRRMILELSSHIDRPLQAGRFHPPKGDTVAQLRAHAQQSAETASHRSSLSIDSGIVSLSSDLKDSPSESSCSRSRTSFDSRVRPCSTCAETSNELASDTADSVDQSSTNSTLYHEMLDVEPERKSSLAGARNSIRGGSYGRNQHKKYRPRCSYYPMENTVLVTPRSTTVKVASGSQHNVMVEPEITRDPLEPLRSVVRRQSAKCNSTAYVKRAAVGRTMSENTRNTETSLLFNTNQRRAPESPGTIVEYNPRPKSLALPLSRPSTPWDDGEQSARTTPGSPRHGSLGVLKSQSVTSLRSTQSTPIPDIQPVRFVSARRRSSIRSKGDRSNGSSTPHLSESECLDDQQPVHVVLSRTQSGQSTAMSLASRGINGRVKKWHESEAL